MFRHGKEAGAMRTMSACDSSDGLTAQMATRDRNRTYTRSEKPRTCSTEMGHRSRSQPRKRETIQIERVRHVSVSERAVAETCRVTLSPKKLKSEMLMAIAMPDHSTEGVSTIWCQPRGRSKNEDRSPNRAITGIKIKMVKAPNRPSKPTATRGATE